IPWVNLYHIDFSRELLEKVPADIAEEFRLIPVYVRHVRRQGDTLYVAMDDPLNLDALQKVADASGLPVKPMVAAPTDIENAIRVYYLGLPPLEKKPPPRPKAKPAPKKAPSDPELEIVEERESEPPEAKSTPTARPSSAPPPRKGAPRFMTLTLLDGTEVRLPAGKKGSGPESAPERGLTTRDLIHALRARAAGE